MKYAVGIDLHGTLLDDRWEIPEGLLAPILDSMGRISDICNLFICTGNDLEFVKEHVQGEVRGLVHGYILETGCVASDGIVEVPLPSDEICLAMRDLEAVLEAMELEDVLYFGRRLATVSLFTRDGRTGVSPAGLLVEVAKLLCELGYDEDVYATRSNVAVDIIPTGYNKFNGLHHSADGSMTVGIADSLNDQHLILHSDHAFLPSNASPQLIQMLEAEGMPVKRLDEMNGASSGVVGISEKSNTEGIIQILDHIDEFLR